MALPLLALAGIGKALKSPLGKKIGGGLKKGIGKIFKKKNRAGGDSLAGTMSNAPVATRLLAGYTGQQIVEDQKPGGDVAEKINDFLGRATKSTRDVTVTTGVDKNTLIYAGVGLLAAWFLFFKK